MNKQTQTFLFNRPINLVEEDKWLLVVAPFEAANSVFNTTNENNLFSVSMPGHWSPRWGAETIHKLHQSLKLRSEKDNELHVEEVRTRENQVKIGDKHYKLSDLDTRKEERIEELIIAEDNNLENKVFRKELKNHEVAEILDTKEIGSKSTGYTLRPRNYEIGDKNLM